MTRFLVATFLILHGLVHVGVYIAPKDEDRPPPFDPSHSWALAAPHFDASARAASVALGLATGAAFAAAGWMVALDVGTWAELAAFGAAIGLVLKALWFNPWLTLAVGLDLGVLIAVITGWPPSLI